MGKITRTILWVLGASAVAWGGLSLIGTVQAGPPAGAGQVRIDLESILVQRFKQFAAGAQPVATENQMKIRLQGRPTGPAEPIEYSEVKLDQAMDNTGRDLLQGRQAGFFGGATGIVSPEERAARAFSFDLPAMGIPAPGAKHLHALSGSVKVRLAANIRQARFTESPLKPRTLTHSMLRDVRIAVQPSEANLLVVKLTGRLDPVTDVGLSSPAGQPIPAVSTQVVREANAATWTLDFGKTPPANSLLAIGVAERTSELIVPFKFENVELP